MKTLALWLTFVPTLFAVCVEVLPDEEYRCDYRPVPADNNLIYLNTQDQWHYATDMYHAGKRGTAVLEPLTPWGWYAGPVSLSPDLKRFIVARVKEGCLFVECSYGHVIPWLAEHRIDADGEWWLHINLLKRQRTPNAAIHAWSTWLHRDLALFNGQIVSGDGPLAPANCPLDAASLDACDAQAFAVTFSDNGFLVEPFARERLWQPNALTGRLNAQPPREIDRCFEGQRMTIVRRHYDELDTPSGWSWFNTRNADGSGGKCRPDLDSYRVPILRTYVVELDAACYPKRSFAELAPVRTPPGEALHRQMSLDSEWGDMLAGISADGEYVVVANNIGDPTRPDDNCAAFELNLRYPGDPLSGVGLRNGHVCRVGQDGVCVTPPVPVPTGDLPPHTPLPSFHTPNPARAGIDRSLVYSFSFKTASVAVARVVRVDMTAAGFTPPIMILDSADYGHPYTDQRPEH